MNKDIEALTQALQQNLELVKLLSQRIEALEGQVEENAAQRMALILLLRATVQSSPDRDEIAALAERTAAQMQVQPGVLLHGSKSIFQRMKSHVDSMTAVDPLRG